MFYKHGKKCDITNVKPMTGNNVSHAVNKTKKVFSNLQNLLFSEILGKKIKLKVTSKGIKTVEKMVVLTNFYLIQKTLNLIAKLEN